MIQADKTNTPKVNFARLISEKLYSYIDDSDIKEQEKYYHQLDKIIDGIVRLRYKKEKAYSEFSDFVALENYLLKLFRCFDEENEISEILLEIYSMQLNDFVGDHISFEEIKETIRNIYIECQKNEVNLNAGIPYELTTTFFNRILNENWSYFASTEKARITSDIEGKLRLAHKKLETILNGKCIKLVEEKIKNGRFKELGTSASELRNELSKTVSTVLASSKATIPENALELLIEEFLKNGTLTEEFIKHVLNTDDKKLIAAILKRFSSVKLKCANCIIVDFDVDSIIHDFGFNHNNYIIGDNGRSVENVSNLTRELSRKDTDRIVNNIDIISELSVLSPFIDLILELDLATFIKIITYYDIIRRKLLKKCAAGADITNIILERIDEIIEQAKSYADFSLSILDESVISKIDERNASEYSKIYMKMLKRKDGRIPHVFFSDGYCTYESGMFSDQNRLIIGKVPSRDSCIDPFSFAGVKTYNEVLLGTYGDVILVRDKNGNFIDRIILIRRGNVVQLGLRIDHNFPYSVIKQIADQIINSAEAAGDNIDYVFTNLHGLARTNKIGKKILQDRRFLSEFPHADFSIDAVLLASKSNQLKVTSKDLHFENPPKAVYEKTRKPVCDNATERDIIRIKTIKACYDDNLDAKEKMKWEVSQFSIDEYQTAICGEDWYILLKNDNTIEELMLFPDDERALAELVEAKKRLIITQNQLNSNEEKGKGVKK